MANVLLYNLAAMTVASTGTGTITLGSAATINGVLYLSFAGAGVTDGQTVAYSINDVGASEVGFGVYTAAGTTLTRNATTSTNSNNAINMTAAAIVRISPRLQDIGTPGQRPATTTNDDASAGNVGEYMEGISSQFGTGTFTVTIASPAVVTQAGHGYSSTGTGVWVPTTTGALPTGLTAGTTYYVIPTTVSGNNFQVATSVANAFAGTAVNTSGSQSGVHTGTTRIAISNGTDAVVAAISLTAGDWDVTGVSGHVAANTTIISQLQGGISPSTTIDTTQGASNQYAVSFITTGSTNLVPHVPLRVKLSATATYYLVVKDSFTTSTMAAFGTIHARRVR
jgi:hypothetical protein